MKIKEKVRNLIWQLAECARTFLMWTLYWTLYFVVGLVMAVPYTYLAGWGDANNLFLTAFALSTTTVILYALYTACKMKRCGIPWWISRVFWSFLGYCLLPIFMNWISIVLKWAGLAGVGSFIFEYRYVSLVAVPLTVIIGLVTYSFANSFLRKWFSGNATPPPSTPPSDFSSNKTATISNHEEHKTDTGTFQLVSD